MLPWKDDLRKLYCNTDDALAIAKRLDDGQVLEDFVVCELGDPLTEYEYYGQCSVCKKELPRNGKCDEHPDAFCGTECREVPKLNDEGKQMHKLTYSILKAGEVKKAAAAATLETAVAAIVAALQALPAPDQKKALAAAKAQLFPKPEAAAASELVGSDIVGGFLSPLE